MKYIRVVEKIVARKTRQIKTLKQKNKRLERKITDLKSLIGNLKNQNLTSVEAAECLLVILSN